MMTDPFAPDAPPCLKPLQVPGFPRPIDLEDGRLTLGRSEDNDVRLPGEVFPAVSNHHAQIQEHDGELWIEDLGSKNGTLVNGDPVERKQLQVGDVIQLGSIGPRFVVVRARPLSETMFVDPKALGAGTDLSETRVRQLVRSRAHRTLFLLGVLGAVAVSALVWWGLDLFERGQTRGELAEAELHAELVEARDVITGLQRRYAERTRQLRARVEYVTGLEQAIARSEAEAKTLRERLDTLEKEGGAAAELSRLRASIAQTRQQLSEARASFAKFDPVNLEQARLSGVSRVRESVVMLEVAMSFQDEEGNFLRWDDRTRSLSLDDESDPWSLKSTGSGFCVSPEGWIITNAHVVRPSDDDDLMSLLAAAGAALEPHLEIQVVFSGTSRRFPATAVSYSPEGIDLALLKIDPSVPIPFLANFDVQVEAPEPGTDIFLFGFPLGNYALQETTAGDIARREDEGSETVIASTFRGILSRMVGGHMQVDAGVHRGNSGGPITDAKGRVIGVVFSVQAAPGGTAETMGYGIPILNARHVWPPPPDWAAQSEEHEESD